jgi:hypothetical protein
LAVSEHPTALGLGIRETNQFVANDVVRQAERTLDSVHRTWLRNEFDDGIVPLMLVVDLVGEATSPPKIDLLDLADSFDT